MNKLALVVDDSRSARVLLHRMLQKYELIVDSVESAEDALDYLIYKRPAVIFMDHMMPGMDGLTAMKTIKQNPDTATIPIVMYTAREGELYVSQARALGAVDVLPKSLEPTAVHALLERIGLLRDDNEPELPPYHEAPVHEIAVHDFGRDDAIVPHPLTGDSDGLSGGVRGVLRKMLNEQRQHIKLDIQAASEQLLSQLRPQTATPVGETPAASAPLWYERVPRWAGFAAGVLVAVPFAVFFASQYQNQAQQQLEQQLAAQGEAKNHTIASETTRLRGRLQMLELELRQRDKAFSEAIAFGLNRGNHFSDSEPPFSMERVSALKLALARLSDQGFTGTVQVDVHYGNFCMQRDRFGNPEMAADTLPWQRCEFSENLQPPSLAPDQTLLWSQIKDETERASRGRVRMNLRLVGVAEPFVAYPSTPLAKEWNEVAKLNQRIEVKLEQVASPTGTAAAR